MAWPLESPPEEDGWVKYFRDGSIEYGYDRLVDSHKASWTRGRQEGMCGIAIRAGDIVAFLIAEVGEQSKFWQSDDYEIELGGNNPHRVLRRIEQKLASKTWRITEIDLKTQEVREFTSKHKI